LVSTTQLLNYWRNSLADIERIALDSKRLKNAYSIPRTNLESGQIPREISLQLFKDLKLTSNPNSKEQASEPDFADVLIAPLQFRHQVKHGQHLFADVYPLWLCAKVDREGRLSVVEPLLYPWLARQLLEPITSAPLILADVDAVDRFLVANPLSIKEDETLTWNEYLAYSLNLLNTVTENQVERLFSLKGYEQLTQSLLIPYMDFKGASRNIINLYDHYLKAENKPHLPALLQRYAQTQAVAERISLNSAEIVSFSKQHLGQMQAKHNLTASQREALSHLFALESNEILAINGPPGTGKTTLLQSAVASLWVESALSEKVPALCVISSTNNQAITNAMEGMQSTTELNGLEKRWLPKIQSQALYLVSDERAKQAIDKGYICLQKNSRGQPQCSISFLNEDVEPHDFQELKHYYLTHFQAQFNIQTQDITQAKHHLHQLLVAKASELKTGIDLAQQLFAAKLGLQQKFPGDLEAYANELDSQLRACESKLTQLTEIQRAWSGLQVRLFWPRLIKFIPAIGKHYQALLTHFCLSHQIFQSLELPVSEDLVSKRISEAFIACNEEHANLKTRAESFHELKQNYLACQRLWDLWLSQQPMQTLDITKLYDYASTGNSNLLNYLDVSLRQQLFLYAMHYWEARWLIDLQQRLNQTQGYAVNHSREAKEKYWHGLAMLFPCFVTTLQTGPGFFTYCYQYGDWRYLVDFIDLMIVDEAGQVNPALAGGMLALAKKALFVGDIQQLQPIVTLPPTVDLGNALRYQVASSVEDYETLKMTGVLMSGDNISSYGSAMLLAQQQCPFWQKNAQGERYPQRGLFLAEHWRCLPEIIAYCNELAYKGYLLPKRSQQGRGFLPPFGYAHIKGQAKISGSSRVNLVEAQAIAEWLATQSTKLLQSYPQYQSLDEIVGIVTPFAAQAQAILKALQAKKLQLQKVGTVHTLQGAEKPLVIFSAVYTTQDTSRYFFDTNINMLNVAVSRAKDSFLVFADMDIFDPLQTQRPSGLLAQYLFAHPSNELTDVPLPHRLDKVSAENCVLINQLEQHREVLRSCFYKAQRQLSIVSPFINLRAINHDEIPIHLDQALARGVKVDIYIDRYLNLNKPSAHQAIELLIKHGATVHQVHNVHSKVICLDQEVFIEGSFNWLSAERQLSQYIRQELSLEYSGPKTKEFITITLDDIKQRILKPTARH